MLPCTSLPQACVRPSSYSSIPTHSPLISVFPLFSPHSLPRPPSHLISTFLKAYSIMNQQSPCSKKNHRETRAFSRNATVAVSYFKGRRRSTVPSNADVLSLKVALGVLPHISFLRQYRNQGPSRLVQSEHQMGLHASSAVCSCSAYSDGQSYRSLLRLRLMLFLEPSSPLLPHSLDGFGRPSGRKSRLDRGRRAKFS